MSKIIGKTESGQKAYIGALSPEEIREANEFLDTLKKEISIFEKELEQKYSPSKLEYKYAIGEFLTNKIVSSNIKEYERLYLWQEIKDWVTTTIVTNKDRGDKRRFYEYCYLLYSFGKDTVFSFTWRQWSELLDRTVTTKDRRLLDWLKNAKSKMTEDQFRMFLLTLNLYLKDHDTSVFTDKELFNKYDQLLEIVFQWNKLFKHYFSGDKKEMSKARREKLTKYKKIYISNVISKAKFKTIEDMLKICEQEFVDTFVDVEK